MAILRNVFGVEDSLITQARESGIQLGKIVLVDEEIQIYCLSRNAQNSQRKAANDSVANLVPIEVGEQAFQHQFKIHRGIVDIALRSGNRLKNRPRGRWMLQALWNEMYR